jgi:ethanolamine ammonia-lyase large subunit
MGWHTDLGGLRHGFADLKALLAKATPEKSGDRLAGLAATSELERVAARHVLAELPLAHFLAEAVVPYEACDVTRLLIDGHDAAAFAPVAHLTVGDFRDWLLSDAATPEALAALAPGLLPEMAAAVSKLMRVQDLVLVASKCRVVTRFRNTIGLPGRLSVRLQPNHPADEPRAIAAAMLDGLLYGIGDAVIGINPATDSLVRIERLLRLVDEVIAAHAIPTQGCLLTHVTNTLELMNRGVPVDLVFQSVAGSQAANAAFGVTLPMLREAEDAARTLARARGRDTAAAAAGVPANAMYFETGQGSALSSGAHHGVDQQTMEARAHGVARAFSPLLVNTVVGFIGPEYLHDGRQIVRAGLEDHFCGKLLGVPLGCDICHTNHAEADADDLDMLLVLLGAAGVTYLMGVPGADDIMLGYQSTSYHDTNVLRRLLALAPAPEFEAWLAAQGIARGPGRLLPAPARQGLLPGVVAAG